MDFKTWYKRQTPYVMETMTFHEIEEYGYMLQFPSGINQEQIITYCVDKKEWDEILAAGFPVWCININVTEEKNYYIFKYGKKYLEMIFEFENGNLERIKTYELFKGKESWRLEEVNIEKNFNQYYSLVCKNIEYMKEKIINQSKNRLDFITGIKTG
jgi:hypothetical protein